ncbi:MAG: hypothetical protein ACE5GE_09735 [Phycisphaerae bacterium]
MNGQSDLEQIAGRLGEFFEPVLPGVEIDVAHSSRWGRVVVTVRHGDFARWLPEQRFKKLVQLIPPEFFEEHLTGVVWFELAPGETPDDLMKARRSEDVAGEEPELARALLGNGFFGALEVALGPSPIETCGGEFGVAKKVLEELGVKGDGQRDTCLMFILNGAYCDCEVLLAVGPALVERYGRS